MTLLEREWKSSAVESPIPDEPPVMRIVLPVTSLRLDLSTVKVVMTVSDATEDVAADQGRELDELESAMKSRCYFASAEYSASHFGPLPNRPELS